MSRMLDFVRFALCRLGIHPTVDIGSNLYQCKRCEALFEYVDRFDCYDGWLRDRVRVWFDGESD